MGPFELLTRGDELPVFAFTLMDEIENYTVFDVSNALRERGWQLPAYTFPENRTDLAALRVVVRRGFTHDMADMLIHDLERQLPRLQKQPAPVTTKSAVRLSLTKGTEGDKRAAGSPIRARRSCLRSCSTHAINVLGACPPLQLRVDSPG
jgi:glutamate/tyrosine decarboxylase-like PLP-dependent enzyme